MNALAMPTLVPAPRGAVWISLIVAFAALVLPNCCVNGRHAFGAATDAFMPICRAAR